MAEGGVSDTSPVGLLVTGAEREHADGFSFEVTVDTDDRRPMRRRIDGRNTSSELLFTNAAGDVGVPKRVVGRQVNVTAQKHRRTVVLAEKQPDRLQVVVIGLDVPVTVDATAKARPAKTSTIVRNIQHEVDPLIADHANKCIPYARVGPQPPTYSSPELRS
jgi:hypothetical protein